MTYTIADLGCGLSKTSPRELIRRFALPKDTEVRVIGVDQIKTSEVVHDLEKYPWPFDDNELNGIYAAGILEHLGNKIEVRRAIKEIWRILKPDGIAIIRLPHCTSVGAHDLDHITTWNSGSFNPYLCKSHENAWRKAEGDPAIFEIESIRMYKDWDGLPARFPINLVHYAITWLANINIGFTERTWIYWVGGFGEITFRLRKLKGDVK